MNHEFKCYLNNKLFPCDTIYLSSDGSYVAVDDFGYRIPDAFEDLKIVFWTGLLDEAGVKIFEGDIVSFQPIDKAGRMNGLVQYDPTYACFYFNTNSQHWFGIQLPSLLECCFPNQPHAYEVKGNIYENPELLK